MKVIDALGNETCYTYVGMMPEISYCMRKREKLKGYQYDNRGNMCALRDSGSLRQVYEFDAANRMNSVESMMHGMTKKMVYGYNAMGQRISQDMYQSEKEGSPVRIMDEEGKSLAVYAYDEFGLRKGENEEQNLFSQPFGFTGYQTDEVSNLYYAQARRYDAVRGRFVSEDPIRYGDN